MGSDQRPPCPLPCLHFWTSEGDSGWRDEKNIPPSELNNPLRHHPRTRGQPEPRQRGGTEGAPLTPRGEAVAGHWVTWSPRESPRPDSYQVSFSLSLFFFLFFSLFFLPFCSISLLSPRGSQTSPTRTPLPWLPARRRGPASHVAQVEVSLLYPPVRRDLLGLVALHVLLHGGQAGAVLSADGALVGRGAVVRAQVLDHG